MENMKKAQIPELLLNLGFLFFFILSKKLFLSNPKSAFTLLFPGMPRLYSSGQGHVSISCGLTPVI